jgi:hypothetical protein
MCDMSRNTPLISGQQQIQFNGPFYTGFKIPTVELIAEGYKETQDRVLKSIKDSGSASLKGWEIEGEEQAEAQKPFWSAHSGYAGKPIVSISFLQKVLSKSEHQEIEVSGHRFIPERVVLFFHDYGTGVITFDGNIHVDGALTFEEYRKVLDELEYELCDKYKKIIKKYCAFLEKKLVSCKISITKPLQHSGKLEEQLETLTKLREILWLHHLCIFSINEKISAKTVAPYRVFLQTTKTGPPKNLSPTPDVKYYTPGWIKSLMIYGKGADKEFDFTRILALAQYHWASTALMDYVLLIEQNDFAARARKHRNIRQMKKDIQYLRRLDEEIYAFQMLKKNAVINLSAEGIRLYKTITEIWLQEELSIDLKEKISRLQRIYGEHIDYLKEHRSKTLERFIKIFTLLSIIPIIFEIIQFIQSGTLVLGPELIINSLIILSVVSTMTVVILLILNYLEHKEI